MNDSEFDKMATDIMLNIEQAIDGSGAEIDLAATGGVLTLEFENGSKIIINKQGAARQMGSRQVRWFSLRVRRW